MRGHSKIVSGIALAVATALAAGCGANAISKIPGVTQTNPTSLGKVQFAVGTVNVGFDSNATGLNTVATFRQSNGLSATLLDTPSITGPNGFVNTASNTDPYSAAGITTNYSCTYGILAAASDSGTASMTSDAQSVAANYVATHTFGRAGSVGGYGMQPFNSTQGGSAYYAGNVDSEDCHGGPRGIQYPAYPQPFYLSQAAWTTLSGEGLHSAPVYLGGPPAYPFFNDGSYPGGFAGFVQGFTAFDIPPVLGQYTLTVVVPASNAPSSTYTASASLTSLDPLPDEAAPTWASDDNGGGGGSVTVPSDPRITETMVYVVDQNAGLYFSVGPLSGTGALDYAIPDNLGKCIPIGCRTGQSMGHGDVVLVYAASYDYPMFEASPPGNRSQAPTITGAGGQADITLSGVTVGAE
ncbi:MAG TPA: hypothetical protein VEJ20_02805 [Candidatus Eremiobacteraceae bacterium]|nr:hypothetical protein [Candidatus Eremiobacteraceae bacterium]